MLERSQRNKEAQAQSLGQKRSAEELGDDTERRDRLGVLTEAGGRLPADALDTSGSPGDAGLLGAEARARALADAPPSNTGPPTS